MPSNYLADDIRRVLIFYNSLVAHFVASSRDSETAELYGVLSGLMSRLIF